MSDWNGKSLLIVDDSEDARILIGEVAKAAGLTVAESLGSGVEALKFLKSQTVDMVSLDIIMPEMDGVECCRRIKNSYPHIEVFYVSALSSESRVVDVYSEDGSPFLPKPLTKEALEGYLNRTTAPSDGSFQVPPPPPPATDTPE